MPAISFHSRQSVEQVEQGCVLAPKFGGDKLIPCVTTAATSDAVLMLDWMNAEREKPTRRITLAAHDK